MTENPTGMRDLSDVLAGLTLHPLVLEDEVYIAEIFVFVHIRDEAGHESWGSSSGDVGDRPSLGMILALEECYADILDSVVADWSDE